MSFQEYLHSFRFGKRFIYTLSIDALLFAIITIMFFTFSQLLKARANAISGGRSPEELKAALLTGSIENSQAFLSHVKIFALVMIFGFILVIVATLLLISLSRSMVWHHLFAQPFSRKKYWRWNLMTLLLGGFAVIFVLLYALVRVLVNILLPLRNDTMYALMVQFLNGLFFISFLFVAGSIYYSFVQRYTVFESVGQGFSLLKLRWSKVWRVFFLVLLTGTVISFMTYYLQKTFLLYQPPWLNAVIGIIILLLFLSWLRLYLFTTLHGSHSLHQERPPHPESNP